MCQKNLLPLTSVLTDYEEVRRFLRIVGSQLPIYTASRNTRLIWSVFTDLSCGLNFSFLSFSFLFFSFIFFSFLFLECLSYSVHGYVYTRWRTKCHTIDCARNTFLLLQKHLTSGTELILIGWKIVPNEEHVQCDHRFASQPLANEPLHSSQLFDTSLQKARGTTSLCGP